MTGTALPNFDIQALLDQDLQALDGAKHHWAKTSVADRIAILGRIKPALMQVAQGWAETAARKKRIPHASPLAGEEWLSGPYALMGACNGLMQTLGAIDRKEYLNHLPLRHLKNGLLAVRVLPHSIWDRLLLSGVSAEVWMQKGISEASLAQHAAVAYDIAPEQRRGKVALVLGAGNIAAISPLDAFQKLFIENQVVLLKMNPVNDYLTDYLNAALRPLIECNALRIVRGDGAVGAYLCEHPLVEEIHITGAKATHDAIVWGIGEEGARNKAANTPKNHRKITSELGAVCPTIVVPGPWSTADIRFQAEQIATHKLHNSGFNCVACQTLIVPRGWQHTDKLLSAISNVMSRYGQREAYYPGNQQRIEEFAAHAGGSDAIDRGLRAPACVLANMDRGDESWLAQHEIFGTALAMKSFEYEDAGSYLESAVVYANDRLYGSLGANILIHPKTVREIGRQRFEELLQKLRYGTIAVNAWTGLGFLLAPCPWGGFPGGSSRDPQSGIGTVHNSFMLEGTERTVISAPWRPFPRSLLSLHPTLLPRPPWFITNRRQDVIGRLLTDFQFKPSWTKLPRIFVNALRG
ncbi:MULTISPECIES: aldehyde dehydrogenase family protein [Pseudomonadota]|uniref:Aldehyde dehydrogenase n=1 Tax=Stenotrophomonas maltophilia TaxID=40324 RepID=A0A2J0UB05_STEMA|nr:MULTISPECIES: aldehyde dehydrogenase family protein [Pseudomonadota]PJL28260.1 aldehyde dehydrogenase [Stenotrophomonas maltophilia]WIM51777.1 aldehyde dehydrogenase family protein [Pseudomonas putida]CAJ9907779.1 betaine-aldehyde dehydrogenase [Burkholderia pseudomallei]CPG55803.1 betaine-aldehyde dehydrogenase [Burkholderia pseudomallei]